MNKWNGCKKEECGLWHGTECMLMVLFEMQCRIHGGYFRSKPKELVVGYDDIIPFTILDLATMGVPHAQIRDFKSVNMGATICTQFHASSNHKDLESLGMLQHLEKHGFIKRVKPEIKEHDWVMHPNGWKGKVYHVRKTEGVADVSCPDLDGLRQWPLSEITVISDPIFPEST